MEIEIDLDNNSIQFPVVSKEIAYALTQAESSVVKFRSFSGLENWVKKNTHSNYFESDISALVEFAVIKADNKPDNILRGLGIHYNLLQNYRSIFLTSSTFLLSLTTFFLTEMYTAETSRSQWVYLFFFFVSSFASFCIIMMWRVVATIRGHVVWFHQLMLRLYENGLYKPYTLYTDVVYFQTEIRSRVHLLSLRTHKVRRNLFREVAANTLRPISYRFGYSANEVDSLVWKNSDKIIQSKMRRYHTTVRRGYLAVSFVMFLASLLMIYFKGEWHEGWVELKTPWQAVK